jgi:hypothetical protein
VTTDDFRRNDDDALDLDEDDDPTDPSHRDHDLSDASPAMSWAPEPDKPWFIRRWMLLVIGLLVCFGLLLPYLQTIF